MDTAKGVPQIWLKYLGEGEPVQITSGDVPAGRPRFSPRGDSILCQRRGEGIWSIPTLGGTPRRVIEAGTCASFFPDGEQMVFDRESFLWTARLDGSDMRKVAGVPAGAQADDAVTGRRLASTPGLPLARRGASVAR